jgi:hypothetical protein
MELAREHLNAVSKPQQIMLPLALYPCRPMRGERIRTADRPLSAYKVNDAKRCADLPKR